LASEFSDSASVGSATAFVADRLLVSLLSGLDATCVLLQRLLNHLMATVQRFQCFIPDGIYLPVPPLYCTQPDVADEVGNEVL
jgi:hypothetical protein